LGRAADVWVETRSTHELTCLRDYDRHASDALTRAKKALWGGRRALIDARIWDAKKRTLGATMITRRKDDLVVDHATAQPVAATPVNQGVVRDERLAQRSSPAVWRRITIETDAAEEVAFPTNELDIEPGVLAFLYLRRAEPLGEHESPRWTAVAYRYPSKISRQVLRFWKHCFLKKTLSRAIRATTQADAHGLSVKVTGHCWYCQSLMTGDPAAADCMRPYM